MQPSLGLHLNLSLKMIILKVALGGEDANQQ